MQFSTNKILVPEKHLSIHNWWLHQKRDKVNGELKMQGVKYVHDLIANIPDNSSNWGVDV